MLLALLMISLVITLAVGFYVFISAPHQPVNRLFALFIGTMLLWIVKDIAFWVFHESDQAGDWWAMASFGVAGALHIPLIYFAWSFPENARIGLKRGLAAAFPVIASLPVIALGLPWRHIGFRENVFYLEITPAAYGLTALAYAYNTLAVWILARKLKKYKGRLLGKHIAYVIAAIITTATLSSISTSIFPLFRRYELLPYASVWIVCGILVYAYAISNFRLFSVQSALDHLRLFSLTYKVAITVAGVGLVAFLLLQIPVVRWSTTADGGFLWKRYLVFSVISGTVPALALIFLIVRTLSRPLRTITEAAVEVSQGNYGATVELESNDEIGVLAGAFNAMSRKLETDIVHIKRMNEVLILAEKFATAGVLAAGVAHEVNNPLAAISSLVQTLLKGEIDQRRREVLSTILAQINRISQILRDLMEFARPKEPCRSPVSLNHIIDYSLRLLMVDKQFKRLNLEKHLDEHLPILDLDRDQMQQVFLNLFLNARDAMPEGGTLSIASRFESESNRVVVEVADTGSGIAPDHLDRIFDPFFTTKPAGKGTGLGLSVCYGIINAHGGELKAVADGNTRFIISLDLDGGGRT